MKAESEKIYLYNRIRRLKLPWGSKMSLDLIGHIYFVVGLILSLMILDYWLTLVGQKSYRKFGRKYVQFEFYELNPIWQKAIKEGKYHPGHLTGVVFILLAIICLFYFSKSKTVYEFVVGGFVILWVNVLSQHIHNIAYFRFIGKHPNLIKGRIEYKMGVSYFSSMLRIFSLFLILLFILIFVHSVFVFGGFIMTSLFVLVYYIWFRKAMKNIK